MTETFLYDTYALIELLNKNPNYEKYSTKEIVINGFIFAEICYQLIKDNVKNLHEYLNEIEIWKQKEKNVNYWLYFLYYGKRVRNKISYRR